MSVLSNFDKWKEFLGNRVKNAEAAGMSENMITEFATEIGNYLSDKIDPENKEERVLKELWDVADENERHTIAGLMVKLGKSNS